MSSTFSNMAEPFALTLKDLYEILEHSELDLQKLLAKDVVILGASGFVGTWLSEALGLARREYGASTRLILANRVVTAEQSRLVAAKIAEVIPVDIRKNCPEIPDGAYVFFGANPARALMNNEDSKMMYETIVQGAKSLLNALDHRSCKITNLSSGAVYGGMNTTRGCFVETDTELVNLKSLNSSYHKGKVFVESFLNTEINEESKISHARLFAFLAPKLPLDEHFAAGNFIRDNLKRQPIQILGDGRTVRTYQYGTDLVQSLFAIAVRGRNRSSYNVGSPTPITISQLAERVAAQGRTTVSYTQSPREESLSVVDRYVPCTEKIESELGVRTLVDIDMAIARTVQWHRNSIANAPA